MRNDKIIVRGAREHNLKNVSVELPRDSLIVMTGLSGSGKSSLAFDTIYAEGQRRYVESLSSYARQFLGQMEKPDVDSIDGLSPAISIDQKTTSKNPRSTVGTVTEIHDYLRLLYARAGVPHCPVCGKEIRQQTVDQIVDQVLTLPERTRIQVMAPVVRSRKGEYAKLFEDMGKQGFVRMRVDGEICEIADPPKLTKTKKHTLEVVVDRLTVRADIQQRLADSLETAMKLAGGLVIVNVVGGEDMLFSQNYACPDCNISIEELTPRMFSFNNPYGACPTCSGLGVLLKMDPNMVIPDRSKSLAQGAIQVSGWNSAEPDSMAQMYLKGLADKYGFSLDTPVCELSDDVVDKLLYGTHGEKIHLEYKREDGGGSFNAPFEGIVTNLERRYRETHSDAMKQVYEGYMAHVPCPECGGKRLKRETLAVTVGGKSIAEVSDMSIDRARAFLANAKLSERQKLIAKQVLKEIDSRLRFLSDVGLDYLTLSRSAGTLSGGEAQRIRLATQIGSSLMGVLYILDEPSIGLHQRDNARLLKTLKGLRDLGNTLIVVEHDEETMLSSDYIVDVGPGAGIHGGEIVACGTPEEIMESPRSITGAYLSGRRKVPSARRAAQAHRLHHRARRARPQPEKHRRAFPARRHDLRHPAFPAVARVRWSTRYSSSPSPASSTARACAPATTIPSRAWSSWTRSSPSTSRPSAARRAPIPLPTPACSTSSATCSPPPTTPAPAATRQTASASTSRAAAARPVPATASARSRCTSSPTSTCPARSAAASATTAKRWRCATRAKTSTRFWK